MRESSRRSRVTFIVLRSMRRPILLLVGVYAVSMAGWVMIPGMDEAGRPDRMSFFHAFYFLTYTATTTGFGELPHSFTDGQRMWGIATLYASVIAWFYAVGAIIRLVQNPHFQHALAERRFALRVKQITEPFCIICGFGNTGSLLARGLSDTGMTGVILDSDTERIKALMLRDYRVPMPGLCADAKVPEHLIEAGLEKPNCHAVVALTPDEHVNLKIAVTARLLNPATRVISRSTTGTFDETLVTLGGDLHISDPFQTYARYLSATIRDPAVHLLTQWLVGTPGASLDLDKAISPPRGPWVICGYGRMGRALRRELESGGASVVAIDPEAQAEEADDGKVIRGRATQDKLEQAGVAQAAGLVAGTNLDTDNLSILINAPALNPDVFRVVRQNRHVNEVVFNRVHADLIMQPSLVSARRILFLITAPLLKPFFEHAREQGLTESNGFLREVMARLRETVGDAKPRLWTLRVDRDSAPALTALAEAGWQIRLDQLLRDPANRRHHLDCVPLVARSGETTKVMPDLSTPARPGDEVLFCGNQRAYTWLTSTLNSEHTLRFLITGVDEPRGHAMRWVMRRWPRLAVPGVAVDAR